MSQRLQVVLQEDEFEEIRNAAAAQRMTVPEWVRQSLRAACRGVPGRSVLDKQRAIAEASKHRFPTADIADMLAEIEHGYRSE
jgi:hypothetical protein